MLRFSWLRVPFPPLPVAAGCSSSQEVSHFRRVSWGKPRSLFYLPELQNVLSFSSAQVTELTHLVATLPGPFCRHWEEHVDDRGEQSLITARDIDHRYLHLVAYEVRSGTMDRQLFHVKHWCKISP